MNLARLSTGIAGFDEILNGGLIPKRAYLVRGGPGCGKTILGLHFLSAGLNQDDKSLYITLGEAAEQIKTNGAILGFDTKAIDFLDLSPGADFFTQVQTYDIFSPAEVEREPTTQRIIETVESLKPKRVLIDSMTHFRYLCTDDFQFRKQVLSFMRFLLETGATVLFTSESSPEAPDDDLQFISDGVIHLNNSPEGRNISVTKFRGSDFLSGLHSLRLTSKGIQVSAKLQPKFFKQEFILETISSGVPELDELLHGGIERGTVTILTGSTGVGKTTLGLQFMKEAIKTSAKKMTDTLDDVLILTKGELTEQKCNLQLLDLPELCNQIIVEIQIATAINHEINFTIQGEYIKVYLDESLIRQILTNLFTNAIKYSSLDTPVDFDLIFQDTEIIFKIKDKGIGIPLKDRPLLFDSFRRASNVGEIPGTGLGLAIVKQSVDLHGGKILKGRRYSPKPLICKADNILW